MAVRSTHLSFVLLFALASFTVAQESKAQGATGSSPAGIYTRSASLEFKDASLSNILGSPVFIGAAQCADDRTVFLDMARPLLNGEGRIYSISKTAVHEYATENISGLHDVRLIGYYASDSGVLLLVNAAREERQGKIRLTLPDGTKSDVKTNVAERKFFLAEFDPEGSYKNTFEVDPAFATDKLLVTEVGAFDSGHLLAVAVARDTANFELAMLNGDGSLLRVLDTPRAIRDSSRKERGLSSGSAADSIKLPAHPQLLPDGGRILVIFPGSILPVLEISEGGAIRTVRLRLPDRLSPLSLIPSIPPNGRWYVRAMKSPEPTNDALQPEATFQTDHTVYEVNSANGAVTRRINSPVVPPASIGCVFDGEFVAFRYDDGKLVEMRAQAKSGN